MSGNRMTCLEGAQSSTRQSKVKWRGPRSWRHVRLQRRDSPRTVRYVSIQTSSPCINMNFTESLINPDLMCPLAGLGRGQEVQFCYSVHTWRWFHPLGRGWRDTLAGCKRPQICCCESRVQVNGVTKIECVLPFLMLAHFNICNFFSGKPSH